LVYASNAISENAAKSFSLLVESRVKAWTLLLLKHSLTGDPNSRQRLLHMLESIIKVNSAQIAFKPLQVGNIPNVEKAEDDPDVILPLIAEVHLIITVHDKKGTVTLKAPGTISANFDRLDDDKVGMGLTSVDIGLKTEVLLEAMVKEARMVVFNAVAKATSGSKTDLNALKTSDGLKTSPRSPLPQGLGKKGLTSARFASSGLLLQKGMHRPPHRFMKAQNSSLQLEKVLSSSAMTSPTASTFQKTRSVQFKNMDLKANLELKARQAEDTKRQKLATATRLTSFKSFGRPHAGDFDSGGGPKNATFANFGGSQNFWGRDGKLASKPMPMLPSDTIDSITSQTRKNANATFESQRPPIHLSRSGLGMPKNKKPITADLLNSAPSSLSRNVLNSAPSSLPRTATAAEVMLLQKMREAKI